MGLVGPGPCLHGRLQMCIRDRVYFVFFWDFLRPYVMYPHAFWKYPAMASDSFFFVNSEAASRALAERGDIVNIAPNAAKNATQKLIVVFIDPPARSLYTNLLIGK